MFTSSHRDGESNVTWRLADEEPPSLAYFGQRTIMSCYVLTFVLLLEVELEAGQQDDRA